MAIARAEKNKKIIQVGESGQRLVRSIKPVKKKSAMDSQKNIWGRSASLSSWSYADKPIKTKPRTMSRSFASSPTWMNRLGTRVGKEISVVSPYARKAGRMAGKVGMGPIKLASRAGNLFSKISKGASKIPSPIRKMGVAGGLIAGATAMLGISIMKGAMNESREIVYERYMQDQAIGKNMLNNSRLGLAAGTSRMSDIGHIMGLSNSLSRTRHS